MLFSIQAVAKAAAFLSVLGLSSARADTHLCDGGPYQGTKSYGQAADELAFCDTKWDKGFSVTGIQMWATKGHVKAFQLAFSDGTKGPIHGNNLDTEGNNGNWYGTGQLSWKEGDLFTDVRLAASYWGGGDRFGGITFEVAGQKFETKSDIGSFPGEPQPLASGLLIGAYGSAGADINHFGLIFLSGVVGKAQIVGMTFPETLEELNDQQEGIEAVTLKGMTYKNSTPLGGSNHTFTFESTEIRTTTRTITQTNQNTFGISISRTVGGSVKVPEVAELKAELTTTASYEHTTISSTADMSQNADQTKFSQGGSLAPGEAAICAATSQSGHYSTDYVNVIEIALDGGQVFKIERPAHFDSVGYTTAVVDCKVVQISSLPDGGASAKEIGEPEGKPAKGKSAKRAIGFQA